MADEYLDFFTQLFYSTEIWWFLGVGIMLAIFMLISYKIKFTFGIFTPMSWIVGYQYLERGAATHQSFIWHSIFMFAGGFFCILLGILCLTRRYEP